MVKTIRCRHCSYPAHAKGMVLAVLMAVALLAAGCMSPVPGDQGFTATPSPALAPADPLPQPLPQAIPKTSALPAIPPVTAIKNLSITRPADCVPVFSPAYTGPGISVLWQFAEPRTAEQINSYLRWDSVQARTNRSETLRIKGMVTGLDEAIGNANLKNDLVLYAGSTDEFTRQIRSAGRSTERGYILASADPSVTCHDRASSGRDTDGYLTLLVFPVRAGNHGLYFNESRREILVTRGMTFELREEELVSRIQFTIDSIPHYKDEEQRNIRLLYLVPIT